MPQITLTKKDGTTIQIESETGAPYVLVDGIHYKWDGTVDADGNTVWNYIEVVDGE